MSETVNAANLSVGAGKIYFDRFDASTGARTGYRFLGECSSLNVTPAEDETRELYSSAAAARPLLKRIVIRRKVTFHVVLREFTKENLALALMAEEAEYTQTATPITGEILSTAPIADRFYKAAKRLMTSVVVKRGAATLVLNTDYKITNAEAGVIYLITGTGTGNLTIDYTPTLLSAGAGRSWVKGAKSSFIEGGLLYLPDPTTGPKWETEVWKLSISPEEDFALIGDDFGQFSIKGEVLDDSTNHPTEPYYQAILQP